MLESPFHDSTTHPQPQELPSQLVKPISCLFVSSHWNGPFPVSTLHSMNSVDSS